MLNKYSMLYLYKPHIPKKSFDDIKKALNKGNLVYGDNCKKFESDFSNYQNIKYSHAVSSGTAALHLALLALEVSNDDIVFVPDFTWSSTVNVVEIVGATPIFIDVDINNYCMDLNHLDSKLSQYENHPGQKIILPVHQHGYPLEMKKLKKLAKENKCFVVEDAACAIGSEFSNTKVGNFSDIACFSFHPRKVLTTGEGGMVATNNSMLSKKLRRLLNHGFLSDMKEYKFPGLNYRMTESQAILGIHGLEDLDERINLRRELKNEYFESLQCIKGINLPEDNLGHNWQTFLITLDNLINRDELVNSLNNKGINIVKGSNSLSSLDFFIKKYGSNPEVPNSVFISSQGISLPFCEAYSKKEVDLVVENLEKEINNI
tara:strand:+ start:8852 stop:9976 length:1125 start_codon:yes stop_codon:yes gene_type:complete